MKKFQVLNWQCYGEVKGRNLYDKNNADPKVKRWSGNSPEGTFTIETHGSKFRFSYAHEGGFGPLYSLSNEVESYLNDETKTFWWDEDLILSGVGQKN